MNANQIIACKNEWMWIKLQEWGMRINFHLSTQSHSNVKRLIVRRTSRWDEHNSSSLFIPSPASAYAAFIRASSPLVRPHKRGLLGVNISQTRDVFSAISTRLAGKREKNSTTRANDNDAGWLYYSSTRSLIFLLCIFLANWLN